MNTTTLDSIKMEAFKEIINIDNEQILTSAIAYIRESKESIVRQISIPPPMEGFMTGDEFERRVKKRVTEFYKENGLL